MHGTTKLKFIDTKVKKLCDGKTDWVRLCMNAAVGVLHMYFGLAVRNQKNVKDMRKGIWATFLHKASADSSPH